MFDEREPICLAGSQQPPLRMSVRMPSGSSDMRIDGGVNVPSPQSSSSSSHRLSTTRVLQSSTGRVVCEVYSTVAPPDPCCASSSSFSNATSAHDLCRIGSRPGSEPTARADSARTAQPEHVPDTRHASCATGTAARTAPHRGGALPRGGCISNGRWRLVRQLRPWHHR